MKRNKIYIAASSQHVGKTTVTLGLLAALKNSAIDVGYCKPLGQQFLNVDGRRVDKDAVLFSDWMEFALEPELHSPVILGPGDTAGYIADPRPGLLIDRIARASAELEGRYEFVVFEGTGHPGVGSVVDVSNADVAKHLDTDVILVLEGGIGNTLDRLSLCKALFDLTGVNILGVIINKVHPSKMEKITHFLQLALDKWGVELLGAIPFDEELVYPAMRHVVNAVDASVLTGEEFLNNVVADTIAGISMEFGSEVDPSKLLLVVSYKRLDEALQGFERLCRERGVPQKLAGIIVTQDAELTDAQIAHCVEFSIPVAATPCDTYDTVIKMDHLVAKIDTQNQDKIRRAITLFEEHVDISRIIGGR